MQDLLHWAHKLALYGLVKLGCVYNFDYMEKLLQILRENRQRKGLSQEYLAGKLGVSSSTISRWESKGNFPSMDKFVEYARYLELSFYDVLALLASERPSLWVRLKYLPTAKQPSIVLSNSSSKKEATILTLPKRT